MSRVTLYVELYNYINVWNQTDWFQVKYINDVYLIQTGTNHCVTTNV
jgi:hypothetical protein